MVRKVSMDMNKPPSISIHIAHPAFTISLSYILSKTQVCPTWVNPVPSPRPSPLRVVVASGWTVTSSAKCGSSSCALGTVTSLLMTETVRDGTWLRGTSDPSLCREARELVGLDEKRVEREKGTDEKRVERKRGMMESLQK